MLKIDTREIWLRSEAPDVAPDVWMMCAAGISLIHLISPGGLSTHPSPDLGEGAGATLPSGGLQNPGPQGTAAHPPHPRPREFGPQSPAQSSLQGDLLTPGGSEGQAKCHTRAPQFSDGGHQ